MGEQLLRLLTILWMISAIILINVSSYQSNKLQTKYEKINKYIHSCKVTYNSQNTILTCPIQEFKIEE